MNGSTKSIDHYLNKIKRTERTIFFAPCTEAEVIKTLSKLKGKTSSGFDGISNAILKDLGNLITKPMTYIINQSMSSGIFPSDMKLADVIPLFKGGDEHLMSKYRPISLLLTLSKLLEKVIYSRVYSLFR